MPFGDDFIDRDGDGFDDNTGLTQSQMAERELRGGVGYIDRDGDGRDDNYNVTPEEYQRTIAARDEAEREAQRQANADAEHERAYDEYTTSGQRQRDLDSGRDPMSSSREQGDGEIPQWVLDTRGVPIAGGPADAWMADYEARRTERGWDRLSDVMPTPDDLAVDYAHDEGVAAGWAPEEVAADQQAIDAQRSALEGLTDIYESGGITDADRARMQLGEMEVGRQMRASREADLAAMQARGMGGSGAEMASMLGAQQAGADGLFARDAEIQARAQDRAMDALAGMSSTGSQMRGQSFDEGAWNEQQRTDYNRWDTDYNRERNRWNTEQTNRSRESRSDARQTVYENRERQQAGRTNQWASAAGGRRQDQARNDENAQGLLSGLGELLGEL